jgi:hypothetical protein
MVSGVWRVEMKKPSKQEIKDGIQANIEAGFLAEVSPGRYALTAMGEAYVKHLLKTDPNAQDFLNRLMDTK